MVQTLIIFSTFESLPIYFLVDGHYAHLNGVLVNCDTDIILQSELNALIYNNNGNKDIGYYNHIELSLEEAMPYIRDRASIVISCGFAP